MTNPVPPAQRPGSPALGAPSHTRYYVVVFAIVLAVIQYIDRVAISLAAPLISQRPGLSTRRRWAWVFAAFTLAYALFEIPTGYCGDQMGARKVLIRVVLWWSFFTAATGLGLELLVALRGRVSSSAPARPAASRTSPAPSTAGCRATSACGRRASSGCRPAGAAPITPLLLVLVLQCNRDTWRRRLRAVRRCSASSGACLLPLVPRQAGRPPEGQRRRARADADLRRQVRSPARAVGGHVLVAARCGCCGSSTSRSATPGTSSSPGSRPI